MKKISCHCRPQHQEGAVLVTGLIFLVIITMIVLSMLMGGTLEERMALNSRNRQIAAQATEAVLRDAERTLFDDANGLLTNANIDCNQFHTLFQPNCEGAIDNQGGLCLSLSDPNAPPVLQTTRWESVDWSSAAATRSFSAVGSNVNNVPNQPRYIVELVESPRRTGPQTPCEPGLVNITARGLGRDNSVVFLQSTYRFKLR